MKVRKTLKKFRPYEWEPSSEQLASKMGIKPGSILRFDTNTSPFPPKKILSELASSLIEVGVNEYPETSYFKLRSSLSKYTGAKPSQIIVTTGADEALDIIAKTFIDSGTGSLVSAPTYTMFRVVVEVMGGKSMSVLRKDDLTDDVDSILKAVNDKTRVIFLCSPNNPTGNLTQRNAILRILQETKCTIVVDEAYVEFCGETAMDLINKYQNLIVLRTFSKAFGLAGARVGYILAAEKTVELLNIMRPPNSLSVISLALAISALRNINHMKKNVGLIVNERERLSQIIKELSGIHMYPSSANFYLLKFLKLKSSYVYSKLLKQGIVSRDVGDQPKLENCLRFTVRTSKENDKLLEVLSKL
ncbi:MAG: histidinol-phosphate transaminase [Candidatus Bathyarchaeota archaeon]